jgi:hypothetical protein
MNILYNESKYILKIEKDDACIGIIQENILKTCSLMIYNIENTELILKNGKTFILGSEQCIFKEILSTFIKSNIDEIKNDDYLAQIDKFIVYDRKRDEKGNVIKNNIIIDNYNNWFQENENQKYINYSSSSSSFIPQNNNIISLFSNIFESSLSNYTQNINLDDNQYINNLFRNYINTQSNNVNTNVQEDENTTQADNNNIEPEPNNINIEEFGNMVNIFDTYINNSEREQRTNNIRNNILYNHFNNIYGNINNNTNNSNETKSNEEPSNNEEETKNNEQTTPETNNDDIEYVNQFITENNINSFIENSPIFNMFRNISANIEIDNPEIINSNDEYLTFNIPISIYNTQHNFEDVIVSLTDEQFNELTCYECTDENTEKDCNICIECFNKDDSIVKLNCNHEFHKNCIKKWLCGNSTKCPVCRVEVAKGKANL